MYRFDQAEVIEVSAHDQRAAALPYLAPFDCLLVQCQELATECARAVSHRRNGSKSAQAFIKSWGMILLSEIGDKTFFIAAIMAMKNSRRGVSRPHARHHLL